MISTDRDSWLRRRNPTVKLAVLTAASFALMFLFEPVPAILLYLGSLVAVIVAGRVSLHTLALVHAPFLLFGLSIFLVNALSRPGEPIADGLPVRITVQGVSMGIALAFRGMVIGVLTIGFLVSTPPRNLMISLVEHARLSPRYAFAVLAGHRMLDLMPERWGTIRAAQAVRAPLTRKGTPRFGLREFGNAAFALLVASIRASERTALALEARGLRDGPRTIWRPTSLGWQDAVLALAVLVPFIVTVVLAAQ